MTVPTTDRAYARGEDAPSGLLAVRVALARNLTAERVVDGDAWQAVDDAEVPTGPAFGELGACEAWIEGKGPERVATYWVGLDPDMGAPNVDAAIARAEEDHPGYSAQDWTAA